MASLLTGTPAVIQIAPFVGADGFHTHGFLHLPCRHGALLHDCALFLDHTLLTFLCVGKWHPWYGTETPASHNYSPFWEGVLNVVNNFQMCMLSRFVHTHGTKQHKGGRPCLLLKQQASYFAGGNYAFKVSMGDLPICKVTDSPSCHQGGCCTASA